MTINNIIAEIKHRSTGLNDEDVRCITWMLDVFQKETLERAAGVADQGCVDPTTRCRVSDAIRALVETGGTK